MSEHQWDLANVRNVLTRLEESILFGLIERVQYRLNKPVYLLDQFGSALGGESLLGFLLKECEKTHALVRRYTSPDEHPFSDRLPGALLPPLSYAENPLRANTINHNARLRRCYEEDILPLVCRPGDDGQYGSSAVLDVSLLQSLSKRVHYGKFVAESKFRSDPRHWLALVRSGDRAALLEAITDETVERQVLDRVVAKTARYVGELDPSTGATRLDPDRVREVYARWIIPLNKEVQVAYLLETSSRPDAEIE